MLSDTNSNAPWIAEVYQIILANPGASWIKDVTRALEETSAKISAEIDDLKISNEELMRSNSALKQELENEPLSDAETHLYCSSSESESSSS